MYSREYEYDVRDPVKTEHHYFDKNEPVVGPRGYDSKAVERRRKANKAARKQRKSK